MNIANLKLFRDGFQKLIDDGIVSQETFDMEYYRIDFMSYAYKIFNFDSIKNQEYNYVFKFLFSSDWKYFDNTPEGALARLDVFLAGNFKYKDEDFVND